MGITSQNRNCQRREALYTSESLPVQYGIGYDVSVDRPFDIDESSSMRIHTLHIVSTGIQCSFVDTEEDENWSDELNQRVILWDPGKPSMTSEGTVSIDHVLQSKCAQASSIGRTVLDRGSRLQSRIVERS